MTGRVSRVIHELLVAADGNGKSLDRVTVRLPAPIFDRIAADLRQSSPMTEADRTWFILNRVRYERGLP